MPLVKNDTIQWFRFLFSSAKSSDLKFHYGQMTDITDLKNTDTDNTTMSDWLNYSNEAVFCQEFEELDLELTLEEKVEKLYQGVYTRANELFIALRGGKSKDDIIGKSHFELFNGRSEDHDIMFEYFLNNDCQIENYLAKHYTPEGYKYFHNTVKGVVENNKLIRVWGSFTDVTNLIKNQEQINDLNEQLSIVSRLAKIGAWETDLTSLKTTASEEFYRLYEIDKSDEISFDYSKRFYSQADYLELLELNQDLIENNTQYLRTYPVKVGNKTKFIEHTAHVKRNKNGKAIKIIGSVQDVTETIINQNELKKTNDYLENIANNSSFYVVRTDIEGKYSFVNQHFKDDFSHLHDKFIGEHFLKSIDSRDHIKTQEVVMQAIADPGKPIYVTLRKPGINGTLYSYWEFICLVDLAGDPSEIQCVGFDISSIKEAEYELSKQKFMLDEMEKLAHVGAWEVYLDSGKVDWSDEVYRIYGLEVGDDNSVQVGISYYDPESQPIIEKAFNECVTEGKQFNVELKFKDAKGIVKWVRAHGIRISDDDGNPISVRGAFQDITSLKRNQVSLLEANKRLIQTSNQFQKLYNDTPAMMFSLDEENEIIAISEYCLEVLGFTRREVLGKKPIDLVTNNFKEITNECLIELRKLGSLNNIEIDFLKKDGAVIHCLLSAIIDNHDYKNKSLVVITDVSERKKAQKIIEEQVTELENTNRQFVNLYNSTPTMLQSLNKEGYIINVSDYWLDKMNYERSEVVGNKFISFLEESSKATGDELLKEIFSNAHVEEKELRLKSKDGRIINGTISSIRISESGIERTHTVIQDVTDKKNYLELIESQNLELMNFKAALDGHLLVSYSSLSGELLEVNQKYEEISGYAENEIIGKSHRVVNSGFHPQDFWADLWDKIKNGKTWRGQIKNRKKDGSHYWVDTIILPIFNSHNEIDYFLEVSSDITLFKNYETELQEMVKERTEALEENNKEREFVLNVLSHDIKNPLSTIVLQLELMKSKLNDVSLLKHINRGSIATKRIQTILEDFNLLQKFENDNYKAKISKVDIGAIVKKTINHFEEEYRLKFQKINITSNSESGHVADSDHVLLSRIFENLISNAIKYSPLNSEIDINLICRLDSCSVEIVDQGEGFDERQKSMLYQQFAKIGNKPTNNESSTGLGLSIVKAACDKLGIGLEVESKKYEGSKFILNFVNNNIK